MDTNLPFALGRITVSEFARRYNVSEIEAAEILAIERGEIRAGVIYDKDGVPLRRPHGPQMNRRCQAGTACLRRFLPPLV